MKSFKFFAQLSLCLGLGLFTTGCGGDDEPEPVRAYLSSEVVEISATGGKEYVSLNFSDEGNYTLNLISNAGWINAATEYGNTFSVSASANRTGDREGGVTVQYLRNGERIGSCWLKVIQLKANDPAPTPEPDNGSSSDNSKLSAPTGLRLYQEGEVIYFTWDPVPGAEAYWVFCDYPGSLEFTTKVKNKTQYTRSHSANSIYDGTYYFRVQAEDAYGTKSEWSRTLSIDYVYTSGSGNSGGGSNSGGDNSGGSNSGNDSGNNSGGNSDNNSGNNSDGSSTQSKLSTPTNLEAYGSSYDSYVQISCDEVPLAYEYELYRSTSASSGYRKITASGGLTASGRYVLTDSSPLSGTSYYKIKAKALSYLNIADSDMSNYVKVTR